MFILSSDFSKLTARALIITMEIIEVIDYVDSLHVAWSDKIMSALNSITAYSSTATFVVGLVGVLLYWN